MNYADILKELPIQRGDHLLVASDVFKFALSLKKEKIRFNPSDFIDTLQETLGESGTLLFPAYNYDFCQGVAFDYNTTPPQKMGTLSNIAFQREDFIRTMHPVFSFLVSLNDKEAYGALRNISGFGSDSPFARLHQQKGKMLFIDVEYNRSFTFCHYVEEQIGVDYRYLKNFTGDYIDEHGISSVRTYQLLVRNLEQGVVNALNPIGERFEEEKAAEVFWMYGTKFVLLDLSKAYGIVKDDILHNSSRNLIKYLL